MIDVQGETSVLGQSSFTSPTLSGIVILVPKHLPYLKDVLSDVKLQSHTFEQVVVVASGFVKSDDVKNLKQSIRQSGIANVELIQTQLASAGANRNSGARAATGEYLVFMDGDDRFTQCRNERLVTLQKEHDFDLLIHAAFNFSKPEDLADLDQFCTSNKVTEHRIWQTAELYSATFPNGTRDKTLEMGGANTNIQLGQLSGKVPIHHGHVVVRKSCFESMQFHEHFFPRNEDGVFARDFLFEMLKVVVTDEILSAYRTYSSASNWRSNLLFNLLRPTISKVRSVLSL